MPYTERDGCKLYYETCGQGEPLALLHGLCADSASWFPVKELLSRRFLLILPDNRFSGKSSCPGSPDAGLKTLADDFKAVLDALKIGRTAVLGHSMGSYVAQEFALAYPDSVSSLVLECTSAVSSARNNSLFGLWARSVEKQGYTDEFWQEMFHWLLSPEVYRSRPAFARACADAAKGYPYLPSPESFAAQVRAIAGHDASARLKGIKARTLAIAGEHDLLMPPGEGRQTARLVPGAAFTSIASAGHLPHAEQTTIFVETAEKFLLS